MLRRILERLALSYGSQRPADRSAPPCLGTVLAGFAYSLCSSVDYFVTHCYPEVDIVYFGVLCPLASLWLVADAIRSWKTATVGGMVVTLFGWMVLRAAVHQYIGNRMEKY